MATGGEGGGGTGVTTGGGGGAGVGDGAIGGVVQAANTATDAAIASVAMRREALAPGSLECEAPCKVVRGASSWNGFDMWILVAEALGALGLFLFIVWWTFGPAQRRDREAMTRLAREEADRRLVEARPTDATKPR